MISNEKNQIHALYGDLANVKTLNDVINLSIAFDKPIKIYSNGTDKRMTSSETLGMYKKEYEKKFGYNGGVYSYFYNGVHYEIPATSGVEKVLIESGFVRDIYIGSILGGIDVPVDYEDYWKTLHFEALCIDSNETLSKRNEALQKSIANATCTPISEELIRTRCFKVPSEGYEFVYEEGYSQNKTIHINKPFKPEMNEALTLRKFSSLVGKMSKFIGGGGYSGQRTFVYLDGSTYVTESDEVIRELKKHGFVESDDVENLGIGWHQKIVDPFYADMYSKVMMSDEQYRKIERKDANQREMDYLKTKQDNLTHENETLISVLSDKLAEEYVRYRENELNDGNKPLELIQYIKTNYPELFTPVIVEKISSKFSK